MSSERKQFESRFPMPRGIYWNVISEQYDGLPDAAGHDNILLYEARWEAWQAARDQGDTEPVGEVAIELSLTGPGVVYADLYEASVTRLAPGTKLYTHPAPGGEQGAKEPADKATAPDATALLGMAECKLMAYEPTPAMVEAAEEAYMPFGDMDLAIRTAILTAPDHFPDAGKIGGAE